MATKKNDIITYKEKKLIRQGNTIYYGDFNDKYITVIDILEEDVVNGLGIPKKLSVKLNIHYGNLKFKPVKKADRESLYVAIDLAEYWLKEALEMDPA